MFSPYILVRYIYNLGQATHKLGQLYRHYMSPIIAWATINGCMNTLLTQNTKLSTPNGMVKPTGGDLGSVT